MVYHGAADAEGVAEVHGGHGGQGVDVFALHPDGLAVVVANAVQKAIFLGKEPRWHAWVEDEDYERKEIGEGHGSADDGEGVVRRSDIIVPGNETFQVSRKS